MTIRLIAIAALFGPVFLAAAAESIGNAIQSRKSTREETS